MTLAAGVGGSSTGSGVDAAAGEISSEGCMVSQATGLLRMELEGPTIQSGDDGGRKEKRILVEVNFKTKLKSSLGIKVSSALAHLLKSLSSSRCFIKRTDL
jgi:hypothetical protein